MQNEQLYLILFGFIAVLFFILTKRSANLAEEQRKKSIIKDLPISTQEVSKLFRKKLPLVNGREKWKTHQATGIDFDRFDEFSPLKIMGYTVGSKGLPADERQKILTASLFGDFQRYMPTGIDFDRRWGEPGSRKRFSAVHTHIRRVKDLRNTRNDMSLARRDWNNDLQYIRVQQNKIYRFRLF